MRLMKHAALAWLLGVALVAFAGQADADVIYSSQSSFLAAAGPVSTDSFTYLAASSCSGGSACAPEKDVTFTGPITSSIPGLTYTAGSGTFFVDGPYWYTLQNTDNRILDNVPGGKITLSFSKVAYSAGFELSALFSSDPSVVINVYGAAGLMDSVTVSAPSTGAGNYFGITTTTAITMITVQSSASDYVDIGGVSVGGKAVAPEPASLTLFGAGLTGLGWLRRRKARATFD